MLKNRLMRRLFAAGGAIVLAALSTLSPVGAQDSAGARGVDDHDWTRLPQTIVEGVAGSASCGWLTIDTGSSQLLIRAGRPSGFRPPSRLHFVNFEPCLNYQGFRVRVTYTAPTGTGYEGDFRIVQVLAAVSVGKGDDVPKFADGPDPMLKLFMSKPESKWVPPPKPWSKAAGVVGAVVCRGQSLTMTFDQSGFTLKVHTDHYLDLPFSASNAGVRDGFNPCKDLKGRTAAVEYSPVKGKAYDGDLASIEAKE